MNFTRENSKNVLKILSQETTVKCSSTVIIFGNRTTPLFLGYHRCEDMFSIFKSDTKMCDNGPFN